MDQTTISKTAKMLCHRMDGKDRQGCRISGVSESDARLNQAAALKMLAADEADGVLD